MSVKEAAKELGTSKRTVYKMIEDGRLEGNKLALSIGDKYIWEINPVSVATLLLQEKASGRKQYRKPKRNEVELVKRAVRQTGLEKS